MGPGLEGVGIYDRFSEFFGVELSRTALSRAAEIFPNMNPIYGDAEYLPAAAHNADVYISLKTFSSSFLDIEEAVRSCALSVKSGGLAIISVPLGYYKDGKLIAGLSPTNYDLALAIDGQFYGVPQRMLPYNLVNKIVQALYKWLFVDIQIDTGRHEFYISARKL
ncbi:methyltransferase domain-containing protein [Marivita sp. S0852]|uniref:methyltransferase domain-containing protein n=1 Tax=Marivita sp. S0852 TaxID=3373893 RepID=UPI0039821859